ncbi:MAG: aldehyde ferredoxin oxidoreductase C-terminal domain-containing protein [Promethearchaeota archaeon]
MEHKADNSPNIFPNLVRIDLAQKKITRERITESHPLRFYAGKALSSKIIADEVPPTCDPLGNENKFVITTGFLTGTPAPNSGRGSVGAKSPLTLGIKESNVGGRTPVLMMRNNIRGLVLENQASDWVIIKIQDGSVEILDGNPYVGLNNYPLTKKLLEEFGSKMGAFSIGIGGEKIFANSTVACTDMEGYPSRHAGRGGMGAVMGSKKVKAIVVIPPKGTLIEFANRDAFNEKSRPWFKALHEAQKDAKHVFGTPGSVMAMNESHGLPTQNYRRGQYEDAEKISGEALHELILKNKGKFGLACSPGCAIQCSNMVMDEAGNHVTSSLEYETIGLLGSNLLNNDLLKISRLDHLCDDLGIDTIETGSCLGVFMEAGIIKWGDADSAIRLVEGMYQENPESMQLGLGVYELGKALKVDRIPHVKRQALPSYEPRALKAPAVTFLTSPMGADHTAGDVTGDHAHLPEGKLALSKERQLTTYLVDSMGICYFVGPSLELTDTMAHLMQARYGDSLYQDVNGWLKWAAKCLVMERDFNTAAGLSPVDTLPLFMLDEKLEEAPIGWDFSQRELETYWEDLE